MSLLVYPAWMVDLVGYVAADAKDDHGERCPAHVSGDCECGLTLAQETISKVPEPLLWAAVGRPVEMEVENTPPQPFADDPAAISMGQAMGAAVLMGTLTQEQAQILTGTFLLGLKQVREPTGTMEATFELVDAMIDERGLHSFAIKPSANGYDIYLQGALPRCIGDLSASAQRIAISKVVMAAGAEA